MDLTTRLRALIRDEEGQDLLEYALLVALIALVALAAIDESGEQISGVFANIATKLGAA
jgi:pilus assembly protein Flp/PilA